MANITDGRSLVVEGKPCRVLRVDERRQPGDYWLAMRGFGPDLEPAQWVAVQDYDVGAMVEIGEVVVRPV